MNDSCRSPFSIGAVCAAVIGSTVLTVAVAQSSRELMEFYGVRPGESGVDAMRGESWQQAGPQSTAADGTQRLDFRVKPWKQVTVMARGDTVVGIDLFAPQGLTAEEAGQAFGLGRLVRIGQPPAEARFATEDLTGELLEAEAAFVVLEMEQQEGRQVVRRIRFFGNKPLPATKAADSQPTDPGNASSVLPWLLDQRMRDRKEAQQRPKNTNQPAVAVAPFNIQQARAHQQAWAEYLGQPVEVTNSIGMKLVLIPPGEFLMGALATEEGHMDWECPQHQVQITRPFYLGIHEVTIGAFRQFVGATNYKTDAERSERGGRGWNDALEKVEQAPKYHWRNTGFPQTDEYPVANVSWNDAVAFCRWLSSKEDREYRLPTEAEWEYACRAGTTTRYYHGDNPEGLAAIGNVADGTQGEETPNRGWGILAKDGYVYAAPVGRFRSNAFGLFDMHGNVWEWCSDWYNAMYYYTADARNDPSGPESGANRILRGGSWSSDTVSHNRSACRVWKEPNDGHHLLGFRVTLGLVDASGR